MEEQNIVEERTHVDDGSDSSDEEEDASTPQIVPSKASITVAAKMTGLMWYRIILPRNDAEANKRRTVWHDVEVCSWLEYTDYSVIHVLCTQVAKFDERAFADAFGRPAFSKEDLTVIGRRNLSNRAIARLSVIRVLDPKRSAQVRRTAGLCDASLQQCDADD